MSRTRDIIEEIVNIRQRRRFGSGMAELTMRLFALEQIFNANEKIDSELIRYFPVALVACMEGYFRISIKELIDAGEPYLSSAEKVTVLPKIDFSLLRAVHGKTITVGELIAHTVQISRLEHINNTLSCLLGKKFLESLRTVSDRWAHEIQGKSLAPILLEPDEVCGDVARTFELRHIICHELASAYEISHEEIARCFKSCVLFLKASEEFISECICPDAPLSQTEMNIAAGKSLNEKQERLTKILGEIRSHIEHSELKEFDDTQEKWQIYCDEWANFIANKQAKGGTLWPLIRATTTEDLVEQRITELIGFKEISDHA